MSKSKNLWVNLGAVILAIVMIGGIVMVKQGRKEVEQAILFENPVKLTPTLPPYAFPTLPPENVEEATAESELTPIATPQPTSTPIPVEAPEVNERLEEVIAEQEQEYQNEKQANLILVKTARDVKSLWENKINEMRAVEREYGKGGLLEEIQREIEKDPSKKEKYTPEVIRKMQGLDFSEIKDFMETTWNPNRRQSSQYIGDKGRKLNELIDQLNGLMDHDADYYFSSKKRLFQLNPKLDNLLKEIKKVSAELEEEYR